MQLDLIDAALDEARKARETRLPEADLLRRQAAEKIWGFVASELSQQLRAHGFAVDAGVEAHRDRRKWLHVLGERLGSDFVQRYDEFARLHGKCFYESNCPPPDELEMRATEARRFVEEVIRGVKEVRRRG